MTAFALFVFMVVALGAAFRYPLIAALIYIWLTCSHPQTGNSGLFALQWPLITISVYAASYFFRPHPDFSLKSSIFTYVLIFYAWTTITLAVAMAPPVAHGLWWDFTRVIVAFVIIGGAISTRRDLNYAVLAMLAGVTSVIASGLSQVILTGGMSHVTGVAGSEFAGNNEVARLFGVAGMPFALFFSFHAQSPLVRQICQWIFIGSIIAILGTYSRGAFVGLAAVYLFWALISRNRTRFIVRGIILAAIAGLLFSSVATTQFFSRMETIQDYQEDASFQGREFAWNFATRIVAQRPITGGGFGTFRLDRDMSNVSGRGNWKDAHSIYFEVLGEHGFVGLGLYLLMLLGTLVKAHRIIRRCAGNPEYYWERDLAIAAEMSLIFHLVGGITISTTYAQYLFLILTIVASLDKITRDVRPKRIGNQAAPGYAAPQFERSTATTALPAPDAIAR